MLSFENRGFKATAQARYFLSAKVDLYEALVNIIKKLQISDSMSIEQCPSTHATLSLLCVCGWSGCRQLELINLSCSSAVKMALRLLDCLFDRGMQAVSNVNGTGKLGKHQLDPVLMYGIQCKAFCHFFLRLLVL